VAGEKHQNGPWSQDISRIYGFGKTQAQPAEQLRVRQRLLPPDRWQSGSPAITYSDRRGSGIVRKPVSVRLSGNNEIFLQKMRNLFELIL